MSKKLIVVIICLIIVLLSKNRENSSLEEAEARLISKMMESDRAVEVFGMNDWGVAT
ncbi:MAG: hypothetical protein IKL05_01735 [Clostridia bacterium]|nr:hypothetical protein [Clostridia bacterium]